MNNIIKLTTPLDKEKTKTLRAGDEVLLSGTIYTARDAAHKRFAETLDKGGELPILLNNQIIYYCGPTPPTPSRVIGSAGPTTSSRMDAFTPQILRETNIAAMIGKGNRSANVINAIKETGAVYFTAIGGCGALASSCITSSKIVCYEDLGPEAVYEFTITDMPLIVAIDSAGNNLYTLGPAEYLKYGK